MVTENGMSIWRGIFIFASAADILCTEHSTTSSATAMAQKNIFLASVRLSVRAPRGVTAR